MKKCRRCTKPATLHITEIKGGEVRALHLCENCAQEYLSNVDAGSTTETEAPFGEPGFGGEETSPQDELTCPHCGMTFKKFRSQGRLGCAHDYEVFRERLVPLLESIHGERQHIGKCPRQRPEGSRRHHELARLRSELKAAVEAEDYERAARLRDSIRELETPHPDSP
jgi:protein arginine kinase activator